MNRHHFIITAVIAAIGLLCCGQSKAFELSSSFWFEGEVTFNVNLPNRHAAANPLLAGSSSLDELQTEFVDTLNEWSNRSTFRFNVDTSTPAVDPCLGNGVQFAANNCGSAFGSSTLAVQTSFFSGARRTRTSINFNTRFAWGIFSGFRSGLVDFRRVALHELGHSVGLNHEDDPALPSIMRTSITGIRELQQDDLNGAAARYDLDNDSVGLVDDNCPDVANPDQLDTDDDGLGNACDPDIDGDGVFNAAAIDQSFAFDPPGLSNSFFPFGSTPNIDTLAQTFTVGFSGQLEAVLAPISCDSGNLTVQLRTTNASGQSQQAAQLTFGAFNEFVLPGNGITVTPGQRLALVTTSNDTCRWQVSLGSVPGYSGGTGFAITTSPNFFSINDDLPFAARVNPQQLDNCPVAVNPDQADDDNNGVGNICEGTFNDRDNDGVADAADNCPSVPNNDQRNSDNDALGNACDSDDDNDTVADSIDNCPINANQNQADDDQDGLGNVCDSVFNDQDRDGVADALDNCVAISNPNQLNTDNDPQGNACDADDDNDTVVDGADNCPVNANSNQADDDQDGFGNVCDSTFNDQDNDTIADALDNCPVQANRNQLDTDRDTFGDVCDDDDDNDTVADAIDNCPTISNLNQEDEDSNNVGDVCEPSALNGDDALCFPVVIANGSVALICL